MARATAALVVGALVLVGAGAAHGSVPVTRDPPPAIAAGDVGTGSTLGGGSPAAPSSTPPTDPGSVSSPTASEDAAGPVGSGAAIIVLLAIGGAFLWLRARTLRR